MSQCLIDVEWILMQLLYLTRTTFFMFPAELIHDSIGGFTWDAYFSCDPVALRALLSVRLSVCHTFFTMFLSSYHHEIFRSDYQ